MDFNTLARIYNRDELIRSINVDSSADISDAKIVENYVHQKGYASLKEINGSFAGYGFDKANNKCVLFRDHFGIQPLYYYLKGDTLKCSFDIRELCADKDLDLSINEKQLYIMLSGANANSATATSFKYIQAVRPSTWCEFSLVNNEWKMQEHLYFEPGCKRIRLKNDEEYIRKLRSLIEDAVRIRLDANDGLIGAEASGGLDSSVIDILIKKFGREAVYASWSASYDEVPKQEIDERSVIEDVLGSINATYDFIPVFDVEANDCITRCLPPDTNTLQISGTAKLMKSKDVNVIFTGHGGDEAVSHRMNIPEFLHAHEYSDYIRFIWDRNKGRNLRTLRVTKQSLRGIFVEYSSLKKPWQNEAMDVREYLNSDFLGKMKNVKFPRLTFAYDPKTYIYEGGWRSRIDNCYYQAMDYGVHYEFPFLDYRVVDFALSIPRRLFLKDKTDRYIYREAFKDIMPKSLYEVNYKDFPSKRSQLEMKPQAGKNVTPEEIEDNKRWAEAVMSTIDKDLWGRYFDYEKCKELLSTPLSKLDESGKCKKSIIYSYVYNCKLIQNLTLV
ncbi:MAG: asparagine synthase-related protein [Saccharofermentans sp.]|nr:asparagine synthase-related protein [Saccharofermentans sp.]